MMEPTTLADAQYQRHNTDKHLVDTTVQNSGFYSVARGPYEIVSQLEFDSFSCWELQEKVTCLSVHLVWR